MGWIKACLIVAALRLRTFLRRWHLVFHRVSTPGSPYRDDLETRLQSERLEREYLETVCGVQGRALNGQAIQRTGQRLLWFLLGGTTVLIGLLSTVGLGEPSREPRTSTEENPTRLRTMDAGAHYSSDAWVDLVPPPAGLAMLEPRRAVVIVLDLHPAIVERIGDRLFYPPAFDSPPEFDIRLPARPFPEPSTPSPPFPAMPNFPGELFVRRD